MSAAARCRASVEQTRCNLLEIVVHFDWFVSLYPWTHQVVAEHIIYAMSANSEALNPRLETQSETHRVGPIRACGQRTVFVALGSARFL